jgi:hypothetical protein
MIVFAFITPIEIQKIIFEYFLMNININLIF